MLTIDALAARERPHMLQNLLSTMSAQNAFLSLQEEQRNQFVEDTVRKFSTSPDGTSITRSALSQRTYSSYLLLNLIENSTYRKMTDFKAFLACMNEVTQQDLTDMSKISANEQRFMNFMRQINILKEDDPKRVQGQKLINKIFE
ncbi:MAG: hypothetical protein ACMG6E_06220, partial [Candidatus Roizmanbacteria bacterium]